MCCGTMSVVERFRCLGVNLIVMGVTLGVVGHICDLSDFLCVCYSTFLCVLKHVLICVFWSLPCGMR